MRGMGRVRVAQMVPDTEAEGPGRRYAVWVQGCAVLCPGCCNPGMLPLEGGQQIQADDLVDGILGTAGIEGITWLGGEPTAQAVPLAAISRRVRASGLSVMLFSGHTLAELRAMGRPEIDALLSACDLLVDGRYLRGEPETRRRWIGSRNQVMHFLSGRYRPDDPVFRAPNTAEIRIRGGEMVINGWPALARRLLR